MSTTGRAHAGMESVGIDAIEDPEANRWFDATHWSVVLAAGELESPTRSKALEALCRTYWQPLYSFLRRSGYPLHDAQDLTQDFLVHLMARNPFGTLQPGRGKFRSFLLVALKNFLADERAKTEAAKRGGGQELFTLNSETAEAVCLQDVASDLSAEKSFDRRWAWTVIDRAFTRLQSEYSSSEKGQLFTRLQSFLSSEGGGRPYQEAAVDLKMSPGAISVAVHRLRQRYRILVREEIAQTVAGPVELDEELQYLLEVLAS